MKWLASWRKRKALREIRYTCSLFGFDLSEFSDEEIERGTMEFGRVINRCGLTTKQVAERLAELARVIAQ